MDDETYKFLTFYSNRFKFAHKPKRMDRAKQEFNSFIYHSYTQPIFRYLDTLYKLEVLEHEDVLKNKQGLRDYTFEAIEIVTR